MARRPADPDEYQMSFGEHLEELRKRLILALLGVVAASVVTFFFAYDIVRWLVAPLNYAQQQAGLPPTTIVTGVLTGFTLYMKVGLIAGAILGSPWILYQVWLFVSAGLYAHERRVVLLLTPFSALMTLLGVLFTYYVLLPLALTFLIGFTASYPNPTQGEPMLIDRLVRALPRWFVGGAPPVQRSPAQGIDALPQQPLPRLPILREDPPDAPEGALWVKVPQNELRMRLDGQVRIVPLSIATLVNPLIAIDEYIGFVTLMMLGIVIAFQVPVLMLMLGWARVIEPARIARTRRYVIFACVVVAAIITPTGDPFNLLMLAVPLWLLFEFGLLVMRLTYRPPEGEGPME